MRATASCHAASTPVSGRHRPLNFCTKTAPSFAQSAANGIMEDQVARLVDKVWKRMRASPPEHRILIGIGGIPGSGKSTLSNMIVSKLNARHIATLTDRPATAPAVATSVPMDGFHLTRAQLSAMPDPAAAHARRGAEHTFDGAGYAALVAALRAPVEAGQPDILAPSFNHAVKDPLKDAIRVRATGDRVVVLEGNYVLLDREPWRGAAAMLDERWFVEVDFAVARRRLVKRHIRAGIAKDEEEAWTRAQENDLVNGRMIVEERVRTLDEVVTSLEDGGWVQEQEHV